MIRLRIVSVLVAGLLFWAPGVSLWAFQIQDYYFPLKTGNAWLYQERVTPAGGEPISQGDLRIIDGTETFGDKTGFRILGRWRMTFPNPLVTEYEVQGWEPDGLKLYRRVERDGPDGSVDDTFTPPLLLAPSTMVLGQRIDMVYGTLSLEAVEKVTVSAGTFPGSLRLSIQSNDAPCLSTLWLAPGIGEVKEREACTEERGTDVVEKELLGARIANTLYGDPVPEDRLLSFALSSLQVQGCSFLLDGIALKGLKDLFWARFDFNPTTLAFELKDAGVDPQILAETPCPFSPPIALDPTGGLVWDHALGYDQTAAFFDAFLGGGTPLLYAEFSFSEARLAFVPLRAWDATGLQIFP